MNEIATKIDVWVDSGEGVERRVRAENQDLMIVEFRFETGGVGALHSHPHTQQQ